MTTTRHRSLIGRGGRKAFEREKGLAHTFSLMCIEALEKKDVSKTDMST